ncbi:hypothetical protein BEWA_023370 [Theileria equi strain WA]|uniref:Gem-associated protein 2 n=1 Tax=Theileria equi strain WA TaxID=1537102 RepID=L0AW79_THEEQ|nr:hypothetical protein BEWA_023370 [Theileria equi strain WA]AFZ79488.1 hypothetical protein BEWA_023370 [Theileria equi strain WA]|eukprot:XP_004829154.1 hypothetical protein BEWA_023370 [Theileria equi strain WA]
MDISDVVEYLKQVKLETEKLPDVVVADGPGREDGTRNELQDDGKTAKQFNRLRHIDKEYERLDSGFRLTDAELEYFRALKKSVAAHGIQSSLADSYLWKYASQFGDAEAPPEQEPSSDLDVTSDDSSDVQLDEEDAAGQKEESESENGVWNKMFQSNPPSVYELCKTGVHFGAIYECLHTIGDRICESPGQQIPEVLLKWLFVILLMLDDLHAMSESVSYELQRIRRAILRRCTIIKGSVDSTQCPNELASSYLLSSIIAMHFNQN